MEENNTEKSLENFDKLTQDNIPRCPNCNLICSLKLLINYKPIARYSADLPGIVPGA